MKEGVLPAQGKLGVLMPGLGAVATTFIAGVEAVKKGLAQPIGALTQMSSIRLGKRTENRFPKLKNLFLLPTLTISLLVAGMYMKIMCTKLHCMQKYLREVC
jgi:myo-inositol-1-phosphate synthase